MPSVSFRSLEPRNHMGCFPAWEDHFQRKVRSPWRTDLRDLSKLSLLYHFLLTEVLFSLLFLLSSISSSRF